MKKLVLWIYWKMFEYHLKRRYHHEIKSNSYRASYQMLKYGDE